MVGADQFLVRPTSSQIQALFEMVRDHCSLSGCLTSGRQDVRTSCVVLGRWDDPGPRDVGLWEMPTRGLSGVIPVIPHPVGWDEWDE